jgi:hypothetical protein
LKELEDKKVEILKESEEKAFQQKRGTTFERPFAERRNWSLERGKGDAG